MKTDDDTYRLTIPAELWAKDGFIVHNTVHVSHTKRGALVLEGPAKAIAEAYTSLTGLQAPPMECVLPVGKRRVKGRVAPWYWWESPWAWVPLVVVGVSVGAAGIAYQVYRDGLVFGWW